MNRPNGVSLALTGFVIASLAAATFGGGPPAAPTSATSAPARPSTPVSAPICPLTPAKEQMAVDAFKRLMPVLTHPRCFNCHGGVNPYLEKAEGGHVGGKMIGPDGRGGPPIRQCQECHDGLREWDTPLPDFFFVGKSPRELCIQFKRSLPNGPFFVGHIERDPFTKSSFVGDRALNGAAKDMAAEASGQPFTNQPPRGTHGQFNAQAQDWSDAVGAGWPVRPDCGCGREVKPWIGTVTAVFTIDLGPESLGKLIETDSATVRFEKDSSFTGPGYWKSVSGKIRWKTWATGGACTGGAAGTVPIGLGSDQNPMAILHLQYGSRGLQFSVGIGPWPDAYLPMIKYFCKDAPTLGLFSLFGAAQWWSHPPEGGDVSINGKTIQGSYRTPFGAGTMEWRWDLHLEE